MKKYIGLVIGTIVCAQAAFAQTTWDSTNCPSDKGSIVTIGNTTFCKSLAGMNWWSAYAWCQAMGGELPTWQQICPGASSLTSNASCGGSWFLGWSKIPADNDFVWIAGRSGSNTSVLKTSRKDSSCNAFCVKN